MNGKAWALRLQAFVLKRRSCVSADVDCSQAGEGYEYADPKLKGGRKLSWREECFNVRGQGPYVCVALPINEQNLFVCVFLFERVKQQNGTGECVNLEFMTELSPFWSEISCESFNLKSSSTDFYQELEPEL